MVIKKRYQILFWYRILSDTIRYEHLLQSRANIDSRQCDNLVSSVKSTPLVKFITPVLNNLVSSVKSTPLVKFITPVLNSCLIVEWNLLEIDVVQHIFSFHLNMEKFHMRDPCSFFMPSYICCLLNNGSFHFHFKIFLLKPFLVKFSKS